MADIFNEIDEDLRRERLGKIWNRYGSYIIALAVLIVIGVAAWRGYEWWQARESAASGARFAAAMKLADDGKHTEAQAAFAAIAKDGTGGYRILARFSAASELAYSDKAGAVAAYDALANENGVDPLARDIARIRAGLLLVDTAPVADIEARMKPLDTPAGPFRNSAREIVGLAQYRAGDYEAATKTFETLLADAELPPGMRQRAELMHTLAAAGAPPPASPAPASPAPEMPALPMPAAPDLPSATEAPHAPGAAPVPAGSLSAPAAPDASAAPEASTAPEGSAAPEAPTVPDVAVPAKEPASPAAEAPAEAAPAAPETAPAATDAAPSAPSEPAPASTTPPTAAEPAAPAPTEPAPATAEPAQPTPAEPAPAAPKTE